jgi:hypothetical protein
MIVVHPYHIFHPRATRRSLRPPQCVWSPGPATEPDCSARPGAGAESAAALQVLAGPGGPSPNTTLVPLQFHPQAPSRSRGEVPRRTLPLERSSVFRRRSVYLRLCGPVRAILSETTMPVSTGTRNTLSEANALVDSEQAQSGFGGEAKFSGVLGFIN